MSRQKINGCLPSNWTRLSCTRINHASIFWSMGRTWFNSRKTKLCGHGEGNTPAVVKKKRYFVLLTFQTTLSLGTRLSKKAVISQTKRDITLKDTHEAQVDSDDSWGVRAMRNFPPPSDPSWDLTVCSLSAALLQTHSHVHTQKQVYIQTHTPDRHRLNASQVRAGPEPVLMQSFLGILSSPLFFLFFSFSSI